MPPVLDASTPARVTSTAGQTLTTATFSPPANSLLLASFAKDGPQTAGATFSNTVTARTWVPIDAEFSVNGLASMAYALNPTALTGITVSGSQTVTGNNQVALKVYVITGHDPAVPIGGQNGGGAAASNSLTTTGFTVLGGDSLGVFAANGASSLLAGNPTSSDTTLDPYNVSTEIYGGAGYKTLGAAGSSATFQITAPGAATPVWNWVSVEILSPAVVTAAKTPPRNRARLIRANYW